MSKESKVEKLSRLYFAARARYRKKETEGLKLKMILARDKYINHKHKESIA